MSSNQKALRRSLKVAMIPLLMAGGAAFASNPRFSSRRTFKKAAVQQVSVQHLRASSTKLNQLDEKPIDQFNAFDTSAKVSISVYAEPEVDVIAFLSDNDLLEAAGNSVSTISADTALTSGRKAFSALKKSCHSIKTHHISRRIKRLYTTNTWGGRTFTGTSITGIVSQGGRKYNRCFTYDAAVYSVVPSHFNFIGRNYINGNWTSVRKDGWTQKVKADVLKAAKAFSNSRKKAKGKNSNAAGFCPAPGASSHDPVDLASGAFYDSFKLLDFGNNTPLDMTLSYHSGKDTGFSYGWSHPYHMTLHDGTTRVGITWSNGRATQYSLGATGYTNKAADASDVLVKNANGTFTLVDRKQSSYIFDATGKLTSITNSHGIVQNLTYDVATGNLLTVTDTHSSLTITFTYDKLNNIASVAGTGVGKAILAIDGATRNLLAITDVLGNTTSFTYDFSNRLLTKTNALGQVVVRNTYHFTGKVLSQDDGDPATPLETFTYGGIASAPFTDYSSRNGQVTKYNFNNKFDVLSTINPLGGKITHAYSPTTGVLTKQTDELNNGTTFTYDAQGYILTRTNAQGKVASYAYDVNHNIIKITDEVGNITSKTYDVNRNVLTSTDAKGKVTTFTYNIKGLLATKKMPNGGITSYIYDAKGNLIKVTDPVGLITRFTYDVAGRVLTTTDGAGKVWSKTYDLLGHVLSDTDPLGNKTLYVYDGLGRLTKETDPKGGITTFAYNVHNKRTSTTDPLGNVTQFTYDGEDRLIKTTDPLGRVSIITRDAKGRILSTTDTLGNITGNTYDAADRKTKATDALNNATSFVYDNLNRQTSATDPLLGKTSNAYDAIGRVTRKTDANGNNTSFAYDAISNLVSTTDALGGSAAQAFDVNGNRTSFTDANGNTTSYVLDAAGRITSITTADGGATTYTYNTQNLVATAKNARNQLVSYSYDAVGRMTKVIDQAGTIVFTYDANGNVLTVADAVGTSTYTYDAANRVASYMDVYGNIISYGYDAVGNLITLIYPGNKVVTYTYDAGNRMVSVKDWANRTTSYTYDKSGNVTTIARANGTSAAYVYDKKGQMTSITEKLANNTNMYSVALAYDAHGNITSETRTPAATAPARAIHAMTFGPDNRLATFDTKPVVYDADGNMTSGPLGGVIRAFTYDARSRLTNTGTSSYVYDASGNRVSAIHGAVTTRYVVDPNAPLSRVLMETSNTGVPVAYYVYGLGLISREAAAGAYHTYHYDSRGSTLKLADATGVVTDSYEYGSFGELLSATGVTANPFKYNGRDGVMTEANGLYYMRARYYTPDAKRFINRDTLLGGIGQALTLNRFAYVEGNPIGFVDPSGKSKLSDFKSFLEKMIERGVDKLCENSNLNYCVKRREKKDDVLNLEVIPDDLCEEPKK